MFNLSTPSHQFNIAVTAAIFKHLLGKENANGTSYEIEKSGKKLPPNKYSLANHVLSAFQKAVKPISFITRSFPFVDDTDSTILAGTRAIEFLPKDKQHQAALSLLKYIEKMQVQGKLTPYTFTTRTSQIIERFCPPDQKKYTLQNTLISLANSHEKMKLPLDQNPFENYITEIFPFKKERGSRKNLPNKTGTEIAQSCLSMQKDGWLPARQTALVVSWLTPLFSQRKQKELNKTCKNLLSSTPPSYPSPRKA